MTLDRLSNAPSLPNLGGTRSLHLWAALGDSRVEQMHADTNAGVGPKLRRTLYNHANVANAMAGNRVSFINLGVSGQRTDQILARLPKAIASGAGVLYLHCGVNNIASVPYTHAVTGQSVTADTVAAVTTADIKLMVDGGRDSGMPVVVTLDPGGTGIVGGATTQLSLLNAGVRALGRTRSQVYIHDLPAAVRSPVGALGAVTFRDGFYLTENGIQTHEATPGSLAGAVPLAEIIRQIVPVLPRHYVDGAENQTDTQLFYNPSFVQVDGGFPVGWGHQTIGSGEATFSVVARQDGRGNELIVAYTFHGPGDGVRIFADQPAAKYKAGDALALLSEITIAAGSTGLAAAYPAILFSYDDQPEMVATGCYSDPAHGAIPTASDVVLMDATETMTVPAFTTPHYLSGSPLWLVAAQAGQGVVRLLMPALRKIQP